MNQPLYIEIVPVEECMGHSLDLFLAFHNEHSAVMRYCDSCAVRLRDEIKRAMREAMNRDEDEGYAAI